MIEKMQKLRVKNEGAYDTCDAVEKFNMIIEKTNELVDAINTIQEEREAERFEIQEWISIIEAVRKSVNIHEKQIDELQMKAEPEKCEAPLEMDMEAEPDFITISYMTDGETQEYYGQNGARVQFDHPIPAGYFITIKEIKGGKK